MSIHPIDLTIIALYVAAMLGVGVWVSRRIGGFDDFFLAGRRMTTPVLVCTLVSTYYGLDVTFGSSETAYLEGISTFWVYSAPFYLAYVATATLVAPRIRRLPVKSLPEVMGHYYGDGGRVCVAAASFVYSAPILSVFGMGLITHVIFGIEPWLGALVGASIALAYTLLGGLLADAVTDSFQFAVMCVTVAIAAVFAVIEVGGPADIATRLPADVFSPLGELGVGDIAIYASIALTPLIEPAFYQRTFAARSSRQIVTALLIGVGLWLAYDWLVIYLGIAGQDMVARGVIDPGVDASEILLHVLVELLPVGVLGLFLAGCLAAAMSTIDSYALIAGGNLVYDIYQPLARRELGDKTLLFWTRAATLVTVGFSLWMALQFDKIRDAWIFMATVLLSTALVPLLAALFVLRHRRPRAGLWSSAAGLASSLGLFVGFLAFGSPAADTVTLGPIEREHALLITLPLATAGFVAGYIVDRLRA